MTPLTAEEVHFERATSDDVEAAIADALRSAGVDSVDELRGQAARSEFSSERARVAWLVISALVAERS